MGLEWEMRMGMEFKGGMGASYTAASLEDAAAAAAASSPAYHYGLPSSDVALGVNVAVGVNDMFPSAFYATDAHFFSSVNPPSDDRNRPSSWQASSQGNQSTFDFDIPCEEEAELAWLSQFVEDSFSDTPYQYHATPSAGHSQPQLRAEESIVGRAVRSKRSRTSILLPVCSPLALAPPLQAPSPSSSSSSSDLPPPQTTSSTVIGGAYTGRGKRGGGGDVVVRRCTHCASEKTPQWRTGPLGPKTLCNACGVRYKSGRLVPEYRPAASPTFVLAQHSNSHRKVMELRRQKEALLHSRDGRLPSAAVSEQLLLDDSDDVIC